MKEKITEIWNNAELDNEAKLTALLDETKNFVPKARVDEYAKRVTNLENEKEQLSNEFEDFKKSKMTDDEKRVAELNRIEADKKANAITKSELAVKGLFLDNGIKITDEDVEMKETLQNIVSEDYDKSIKLANNFISLLNKTKENAEKETITNLLNDTPKPVGGTQGTPNVDRIAELKTQLDEAVKKNDTIAQVQITNAIFEEQKKKKN